MTRSVLGSIVLVLVTGGFAVAGGLTDTQPDRALRDKTGGAAATETKQVSVGNSGAPASLARDEAVIEYESNVNAEGAEEELGEAERSTISQ